MTYWRAFRDATLVLASVSLMSCGGPSSPAPVTEAQVVTDGSWSGTLGERGQMSGPFGSGILNIGSGRQCATVHRNSGGFLTLRVGAEREVGIVGNAGIGVNVTVCGEGLLR